MMVVALLSPPPCHGTIMIVVALPSSLHGIIIIMVVTRLYIVMLFSSVGYLHTMRTGDQLSKAKSLLAWIKAHGNKKPGLGKGADQDEKNHTNWIKRIRKGTVKPAIMSFIQDNAEYLGFILQTTKDEEEVRKWVTVEREGVCSSFNQ